MLSGISCSSIAIVTSPAATSGLSSGNRRAVIARITSEAIIVIHSACYITVGTHRTWYRNTRSCLNQCQQLLASANIYLHTITSSCNIFRDFRTVTSVFTFLTYCNFTLRKLKGRLRAWGWVSGVSTCLLHSSHLRYNSHQLHHPSDPMCMLLHSREIQGHTDLWVL